MIWYSVIFHLSLYLDLKFHRPTQIGLAKISTNV
jgi:hypothetical protein